MFSHVGLDNNEISGGRASLPSPTSNWTDMYKACDREFEILEDDELPKVS